MESRRTTGTAIGVLASAVPLLAILAIVPACGSDEPTPEMDSGSSDATTSNSTEVDPTGGPQDSSATTSADGGSSDEGDGTTSSGETGEPPEVCDSGFDFLADYLQRNPLAPGEWSAAIEGMDGLNTWHDPNARQGAIRANGQPIVGSTVTLDESLDLQVGDTVLIRGSSLDTQIRTIVSIVGSDVTLDASADAPADVDIILFPDYYTRSLPFEDEGGGQFLDWNAHFYYDAQTGLHTIGGGVGSSSSYSDAEYKTWRIRYDPCLNRWYKIWNPLGIGSGHHYASNAIDPAGRRYFRGYQSFDLDDDTAEPVDLGTPGDPAGTASTFAYHEGLDRLYRATSYGNVRYWDQSGWSDAELVDGLNNHPISAYLAGAQTLVFGGGNAPADAMYAVDQTGTISALDPIPAELLVFNAKETMILDVGFEDRLVVMRDSWEAGGNPTPEIWWLLPNAPEGMQWQQSPDTIAPELAVYDGVKRELAATAIRHLGVVMVMRHWGSATVDAADPAQRRAAVWLYRPSSR